MSEDYAMWEWGGPVSERLRGRKAHDEEDSERGMPLPPMSPLWREHGKGQGGGGIHIVVCCCNEDEEELKVLLSTFRTDARATCPVRVSFLLDTLGPAQPTSETYEVLKQILRIAPDDNDGSFGEFGCVEHSGSLDKTRIPFDLYVKGPSIPAGKRNSLVMFFDDILPVKISRGATVEPDVVYLLDADSGHPTNGLLDLDSMWRLLMVEEEAACITCPVKPSNPTESFLAASQSLEYALVWDNVGESHFGVQTICRGAQCMFKYRCLVEDGRLAQPPVGEGAMPPLLDAFSKTAAGMPALILLDTCPNEGLLVLLRQRGFDVRACGVADAVTCVPNSWLEFYAQRRRWYAGSLLAVASHLTGKESYFQMTWRRWIISSYALVANLYLHCGLACIPVLLAKGIYRIIEHIEGSTEDLEEELQEESSNSVYLEWVIFALVWGFLLLNICVYLRRSQDQLWLWINVTSVFWMTLCLVTLIGSGIAISPYIPVVVLVVPLILGGLNSATDMVSTWCYFAMAALPFVLFTAVNSVLVFLYAMATLDSTEWGTREVGSFDSGLTVAREASIRRRKLCLLFTVTAISCGLGIMLMVFPSYVFLTVVIGIPAAAFTLKLLLVVIPAKLERSRQNMILGDAGSTPLSFRRNMSEMAPVHGRASENRAGRYGSSSRNGGGGRGGRKGQATKSPTEVGSHVTAEDGTPSPSGNDVSGSESFFGASAIVGGSESMTGSVASDRLGGHRRRGSKSASISSGFAGVAGIGGGGIGGGDLTGGGAHSTHSAGSRQSNAGSKPESRAGSRTSSRGSGEGGPGSARSGSRSRSRSRSRSSSPSASLPAHAEEVADKPTTTETADTAGRMTPVMMTPARMAAGRMAPGRMTPGRMTPGRMTPGRIGAGIRAGVRKMNSRGEKGRADPHQGTPGSADGRVSNEPPKGARRTGFAQFLNAKDSVDEIDTSVTPPKARPASARSSKADIRKAWGLRQATMDSTDSLLESSDTIRFNEMASKAFGREPNPRGGRGGGPGVRWGSNSTPCTPQKSLKVKDAGTSSAAAAAAPGEAGVKRYSWAIKRLSTEGSEAPSQPEGGEAPRTPERARGEKSSSWGRSKMGSQDDMACPSPATINAILNSRVGAVYSRGGRDVNLPGVSSLPPAVGSRRRPAAESALAGVRAAWGIPSGGSQDDLDLPAPTTAKSNRGPKLSEFYKEGVIEDDEDEDDDDGDCNGNGAAHAGVSAIPHRPVGVAKSTLVGIRAGWGGGSHDDLTSPPLSVNGETPHYVVGGGVDAPAGVEEYHDETESDTEDMDLLPFEPQRHSRNVVGADTLAGVRASWGQSSMGSQDDLACPSPATLNAILNSRVGAVYSRGRRDDRVGGGSVGGGGHHRTRSTPAPTRTRGGRGGPTYAAGTGEDPSLMPRPPKGVSTPSARPRSQRRSVGGGVDGSDRRGRDSGSVARAQPRGRSANHAGGDGRSHVRGHSASAAIGGERRNAGGDYGGSGGVGEPRRRVGGGSGGVGEPRRRVGGGSGAVGDSRRRASGGSGPVGDSRRRADGAARGGVAFANSVEAAPSAPGDGGEGRNSGGLADNTGSASSGGAASVVVPAVARRNWTAGQSSVFDTSGSSSSEDEGKPRGLRGVQILDPEPSDVEMRRSGSIVRGGGAAAGGGGVGGGGGAVGNSSRRPGGGVPGNDAGPLQGHVTGGGSAAMRGASPLPNSSGTPHADTLKDVPGAGGYGSDLASQQTRD